MSEMPLKWPLWPVLFPTLIHHSFYTAAYFSRVKFLLILLSARRVSFFSFTLEGLQSPSAVPFGSVINLERARKETESSLANTHAARRRFCPCRLMTVCSISCRQCHNTPALIFGTEVRNKPWRHLRGKAEWEIMSSVCVFFPLFPIYNYIVGLLSVPTVFILYCSRLFHKHITPP